MIGGALAGLGWWFLRSRAEVPPLVGHRARSTYSRAAVRLRCRAAGVGGRRRCVAGTRSAPRQLAAALGDFATGWLKRLSPRDREILLACAAGAGLGAVYAVPLGGALYTLRIMLKTWHPRSVGAALITSSLAVSVASFVTHNQPNLDWPNPQTSYLLIGYAIALAPLSLVLGLGSIV